MPFVAYGPGLIQSGVVSDELIDLGDFLATFCDIAGVPIPEAHLPTDGISFWDHLQGKPGRQKPWVYIYYPENKVSISARNKTHMLVRPDPSKPEAYTFYNTERRYHPLARPLEALSPEEQTHYETLHEVIKSYDRTKPRTTP